MHIEDLYLVNGVLVVEYDIDHLDDDALRELGEHWVNIAEQYLVELAAFKLTDNGLTLELSHFLNGEDTLDESTLENHFLLFDEV